MAQLKDVELIYPGTWNDLSFNNANIVEMVNNSNFCLPQTQPQLSLNHDEVASDIIRQASFGAIVKFRMTVRAGVNMMCCTIDNVRDELANLLKYHYPRRSIEFWEQYTHDPTGRNLRNVVFGVSFLGAKMPPAVKALSTDMIVNYHDTIKRHGITIVVPARRQNMKKKRKNFKDDTAIPAGGEPTQDRPITQAGSEDGTQPATGTTNELGLFLAARRAELGFTPDDVAMKINESRSDIDTVTEQMILDIENGIVIPAEPMRADLSEVLEIARDTLDGLMILPSDVMQQFTARMERTIQNMLRRFQDEHAETLGAYLRRIREERELSLDDLATAIETTSDELAAIEDAQMPEDDLLEKLAEVLELSFDELKVRRDAELQAQNAETDVENTDVEDEESMPQQFRDQLVPIQQEISRLKRERKDAKRQQKVDSVERFLGELTHNFNASKLLTGSRIRTLLVKAEDKVPVKFSEHSAAKTTFNELKDLLTDIARIGADAVTVPGGHMTVPGQQPKKNTQDAAIQQFQEKHGIMSFRRAATLYFQQQRQE